jgi:hypothetical protein
VILLLYGLPGWISLPVLVALAVAFYRGGPFAALTTTLVLLLATVAYATLIQAFGLMDAIYFEPHARFGDWDFASHHRVYERDVAVTMPMPHGNLQAMTPEPIAQPRAVRFVTDADGFRNDRAYHGQRWVLVGDSFVVGNGSDQADTLNARLERDHGIESYNLGQAGDPYDYLLYVDGFRRRHGRDFRLLLFFFEGNDFGRTLPHPDRRHTAVWESRAKRLRMLLSDRSVYRVTKVLYERVTHRSAIAGAELVTVRELASGPFALYNPYIEVAERPQYEPPAELGLILDLLAPDTEHVFFIPTKYRVYRRSLGDSGELPHAQWLALRALCEARALASTDLTPALIAQAEELLPGGGLIWWRDDTHWNGEGVAVAARVVAATLQQPVAASR